MDSRDWKNESRKDWSTTNSAGDIIKPDKDGLTVGCLQRIADATEKMTHNIARTETDRDRYKRLYNSEKESTQRMANQIRALKGVITKLKKKKQPIIIHTSQGAARIK